MSNTVGSKLKVTIFGQSHAEAIGAVIDGLPAGMELDMGKIETFMQRRAPGRDDLSTTRKEADVPRILSGLNDRRETCGAPLCAVIENSDTRSGDYAALRDLPRPGHSDYTAYIKFSGANDIRGGGQFSGRLTAPLCFAGAVCMQLPTMREHKITIAAHLLSIGNAHDARMNPLGMDEETLRALSEKPLPVFDDLAARQMREEISAARRSGDSVGGVIEVMATNVPAGLGDPMFDGLESAIAKIMFSIPGVRGVEFGTGFDAARMRGSEHNDPFVVDEGGNVRTSTNHHGGILGGISSGMPLIVRVAMKPTPSIAREQDSVSLSENAPKKLGVRGRHDPCIAPRAVPCVEAALAIALADVLV